jgi:hypothetical protein
MLVEAWPPECARASTAHTSSSLSRSSSSAVSDADSVDTSESAEARLTADARSGFSSVCTKSTCMAQHRIMNPLREFTQHIQPRPTHPHGHYSSRANSNGSADRKAGRQTDRPTGRQTGRRSAPGSSGRRGSLRARAGFAVVAARSRRTCAPQWSSCARTYPRSGECAAVCLQRELRVAAITPSPAQPRQHTVAISPGAS